MTDLKSKLRRSLLDLRFDVNMYHAENWKYVGTNGEIIFKKKVCWHKDHVTCMIRDAMLCSGCSLRCEMYLQRTFGCWLCWGLTSQSTIFQSCWDGAIASWVINQYFRGVKCLAQGHNTAAVGFEPRSSRSGVRHSTTEPPRSPFKELTTYPEYG